MSSRNLLGRGSTFAMAGLLTLTMSACGSGDDQTDAAPLTPSPSQSATSPSAAPSEEASDSPPSASTPKETQALLRAGRTGLEQVSNSTVYSIESENEGDDWEVEVVTPDGTKHEMYISRDGRDVAQPPRDDGRKAKYRERIQGAKLDFQKAVETILVELPDARFKELELDHENGTIVWEADVVDGTGTARSVEIDAASGEVLKNELDT